MLTSRFARKLGAAVLLIACSVPSTQAAEPLLCEEFRQLLKSGDIDRYLLQLSAQPGDEAQYYNLDIDGDNMSDVVKGSCPASLETGDLCTLQLELSSRKQFSFDFEPDERFFLARYESRIYAVARAALPTGGFASSVLKLDAEGVSRICLGL